MVTAIDDSGLESPAIASEPALISRPGKRFKLTIQISKEQVDALLADPVKKAKLIQDLINVLAAQMGINPNRIEIVSLASGSLIIEFDIFEDEADPTAPTSDAALATLQQAIDDDATTNALSAAFEAGTDLTGIEGFGDLVVVLPAKIDLSGVAFNFAQVTVGQTLAKTLTIKNTGALTLEGTLTLGGTGAAAFALSTAGFALEGGESVDVIISFTPADTVAYAASIQVASNDAQNPSVTVLLSGKGATVVALLGDFDGNGKVDFDDSFLFADHFGTTPASPIWDPIYSLDGDPDVDFDDFFIFADHFGETVGGG
jgi:hypothetical protein